MNHKEERWKLEIHWALFNQRCQEVLHHTITAKLQELSLHLQAIPIRENEGICSNSRYGIDGCDVVLVSGEQQPPPADSGAWEWRESAGSEADGGIQTVEFAVQPAVSAGEGQRRVVQAVVRPGSSSNSVHPMLRGPDDALL